MKNNERKNMTGLNLHNIVAGALSLVNPWKTLVFTHTAITWDPSSREPVRKTETIEVQGKLQPASEQLLMQLGFNVQEYQYFRGYVSHEATQLDQIRQLGCDTFMCEGLKYRLVGKKDWIQDGWRCFYCYLDQEEADAGTKGV